MLWKVEVRNAAGDLLSLELQDISDGIVLEDVDGLGPVKATVVSSSFAQQDGEQYHSSWRGKRNITLKLSFRPDYVTNSVRELRHRMYRFFMTKIPVSLRFYDTEGPEVDVSGRVEDCEPTIFAKEPGMDISILCFQPDFVDLDTVTLSGNTTPSTTETSVVYDGTVETGVVFTLNVNRTLSEFTIYHRPPDGTLRSMDVQAPLVTGDVVKISTIPGDKYATITRTGSTTSALDYVSPQANWMELEQGNNNIRIYAEGAGVPYTIEYNTRYGGL